MIQRTRETMETTPKAGIARASPGAGRRRGRRGRWRRGRRSGWRRGRRPAPPGRLGGGPVGKAEDVYKGPPNCNTKNTPLCVREVPLLLEGLFFGSHKNLGDLILRDQKKPKPKWPHDRRRRRGVPPTTPTPPGFHGNVREGGANTLPPPSSHRGVWTPPPLAPCVSRGTLGGGSISGGGWSNPIHAITATILSGIGAPGRG